MKAQNLTAERINGSDFNLDFSLDEISEEAANKLPELLSLALYGDENVTEGSVAFSFELSGDEYVIKRDFDNETLVLQKNCEEIADAQKYIDELLGDKKIFISSFIVLEDNADEILADPAAYIVKTLADYGIDTDEINAKIKTCADEISAIHANLSYLSCMKIKDSDENNIEAEIDDIEKDLYEIDRQIVLAEDALENKKELDELRNQLTADDDAGKAAAVTEIRENLEKARQDLFSAESEVARLAEERAAAENKVKELNESFKAFALEGFADPDNEISAKLAAYYAEYDKKAEALSEKQAALAAEYEETCALLEEARKTLESAKLPSAIRKAVRDGLVLETRSGDNKTLLERLDVEINQTNARIAALKEKIARDEAALLDARSKSAEILGKEATYQQLYAELNSNEKEKQTLYRNQIIIANTEREINAVDNKIYENEEAQRSYIEDRNALENAKATLLGYMKKLDDRFKAIEEKLVTVSAQKKYYDTIDATSFGDKCPVCKNHIMEKADFSKEGALIEKAYKDLIEEKKKALRIKQEYDERLDKINLRLGEFNNRINTSETYLDSLRETKAAKLELIEKLLEASNVRSFASLSAALDVAIKRVAINTNELIEAGLFAKIEEYVNNGTQDAREEVRYLEETVLPAATSLKQMLEEENANVDKDLNEAIATIGMAPFEKSEDITAAEMQEDELNKKLDELAAKKARLAEQISQCEKEIISIVSRDNTIIVNKDGADLTYTALYAELIKEQFAALTEEIKQAEEVKLGLDTQYEVNLNLVASLKAEEEKLSSEIEALCDNEAISRRIKALEERMEEAKAYLEAYNENLSARQKLKELLAEKRASLASVLADKAKNDYIAENIAALNERLESVKSSYSKFTAAGDNNFDEIIASAVKQLENVPENAPGGKALALLSLEKAIAEFIKEWDKKTMPRLFIVYAPAECEIAMKIKETAAYIDWAVLFA